MNRVSLTKMRLPCFLAAAFAVNAVAPAKPASAQASTPSPPMSWTTLGTQAGPVPNAQRSQPANLLVVAGKPWLVDCGDGAVERLAAAGYKPAQVNTLFLSHLHMDHIGGLLGLIGLRWFAPGKRSLLTIYGPPGTDTVVAGIMKTLKPPVEIGMGVGPEAATPEQEVKVVIIKGGSDLTVDGVRVRAVRNSHFDDPPGHPALDGSQSLSYRFDYRNYGIGFTGDTGPCPAVAPLEKGVNLLVSEVLDLPGLMAPLNNPKVPPQARQDMIDHYKWQHISPQEAGQIAAEAGAGRLVFTHLGIAGTTDASAAKLIREAHETYKGQVIVAHDLDKF